jgi:hypothetical protein
MIRSYLSALFLCSTALSWAGDRAGESAAGRPPATMTFEQVRASITTAHARIKSLRVDFRARDDHGPNEYYLHRTFAAKGSSRESFAEHLIAGTDNEDINATRIFFHQGWLKVFFPYERRVDVTKRFAIEPYISKTRAEVFVDLLSWYPADDPLPAPSDDGRPFVLRDVLNQAGCRLRPDQEPVDGRWCHVVEAPGSELLVIDAERGVLMRRERRGSTGETPRKLMRDEMSQVREVAPGIFLPYCFHRTVPERGLEFRYDVDRYEVNTLTDDQFDYKPGPGTLVVDRDTDTWSAIPGGLDFLELTCRRVRAYSSPGAPRAGPAKRPGAIPIHLALFAGGVVAYGILARLSRTWGRAHRGIRRSVGYSST